MIEMDPATEERARELAEAIRHERIGLANEDAQAAGVVHKSYARAAKYRDQDRAKIQGEVIGLTYMMGRPLDIALAEAFIANEPYWRAL